MVIVAFVFKDAELGQQETLRHEPALRHWLMKNSYNFNCLDEHGCCLYFLHGCNNILEKLT